MVTFQSNESLATSAGVRSAYPSTRKDLSAAIFGDFKTSKNSNTVDRNPDPSLVSRSVKTK